MSHRDSLIKKNKELSKPMDIMNVGFVGVAGGGGGTEVTSYSGASQSQSGSYTYYTWTSSGSVQVASGEVEVLVVAGGGSSGSSLSGGGGGGEVMKSNLFTLPTNTQTVTVGNGATAGNGVNAEAIIEADNFPAGQWIYGRWSACTLDDGAAFLYFADE